MGEKPNGSVKKQASTSLGGYVRKKRNALIVSAISLILAVVVLGTISGVIQELLNEFLLREKHKIDIQLVNSFVGVFTIANSEKVLQLLAYTVSVSDLTRDIKISAIFSQHTEIKHCHVTYTVDLKGFKFDTLDKNYAEIHLDHALSAPRRANIYLWTERNYVRGTNVRLDVPDISVEGKRVDGTTVYR